MTTCQRLKEENKALKQEILDLILYPESLKAAEIKMKWKMVAQAEKVIMAGTHEETYTETTQGLLTQIRYNGK